MIKTIIIIEDDPAIVEPMTIALKNSGYFVITYFSGEQILNNDFVPPDIFLVDKQLPMVDGLDICRHLKQNEKTMHIPVIIVSATPGIKTLAKQAMADDILEKPFTIKQLRDVVAMHIIK